MYSRRTGVLQTSTEGLKKIENFNQNLREQYSQRNKAPAQNTQTGSTNSLNKIKDIILSEEIILIGLILLLLFETNKDYMLIGIIGLLILMN